MGKVNFLKKTINENDINAQYIDIPTTIENWVAYALDALSVADEFQNDYELDSEGKRYVKYIDDLDNKVIYELEKKYPNTVFNFHTNRDGLQEINLTLDDGTKGIFKTNGERELTNTPFDDEFVFYIDNIVPAFCDGKVDILQHKFSEELKNINHNLKKISSDFNKMTRYQKRYVCEMLRLFNYKMTNIE